MKPLLKAKWPPTPSSDLIETCQRMMPATEHLFIDGAYDELDRYIIKLIDEGYKEWLIEQQK